MDRDSRESGQATVMVALAMVGILGFTSLAIDVGMLFHTKRTLQTAADAAAVAGASEYPYTNATGVQNAAYAASSANGMTNGSNGVTVTVNNPPKGGSHTGAGNVEVIVTQNAGTFLMGLFGKSSVPVAARAVAYKGAPSNACLYVMAPSGARMPCNCRVRSTYPLRTAASSLTRTIRML